MKINKVTRVTNNHSDCLEVEVEADGQINKVCFTEAKEFLTLENGEEKFIARLRENSSKNKSSNPKSLNLEEEENIDVVTELTDFKDKNI